MKKSKKITLLSVAFIAVVACLLMAATTARGGGTIERIEDRIGILHLDTGQTCVITYMGELYEPWVKCYCPCESDCEFSPEPTVSPTDETPVPSETPEPTEKPKCNSGRGNASEGDPDCDPGNSGGHNQGGD